MCNVYTCECIHNSKWKSEVCWSLPGNTIEIPFEILLLSIFTHILVIELVWFRALHFVKWRIIQIQLLNIYLLDDENWCWSLKVISVRETFINDIILQLFPKTAETFINSILIGQFSSVLSRPKCVDGLDVRNRAIAKFYSDKCRKWKFQKYNWNFEQISIVF